MVEYGFTASALAFAAKLTWETVDDDMRKKLIISGYAESSNKPLQCLSAEAKAKRSMATAAYIQLRKLSPAIAPQGAMLTVINQADPDPSSIEQLLSLNYCTSCSLNLTAI